MSSCNMDCEVFEWIWGWLRDRNIYFCEDHTDFYTNSWKQMLTCIDFLAKKGHFMFIRLKSETECVANGFIDVMDELQIFKLKQSEVAVIKLVDELFRPEDYIIISDIINESDIDGYNITVYYNK